MFREYFGVGPIVAIILWESLYLHDLIPEGGQLIHLLWTLCFLKEYGKTHQMANQAKVDAKTYQKYVWRFIVAISDLEVHVVRFSMIHCHIIVSFLFLKFFLQIKFSNRYAEDEGNDCLVSVDGTDFCIPELGKIFYSFKFRKSGLRYEVAICIKTGWIVWFNGPYEPGLYNDLQIFRESFKTFLDKGERIEADDGYIGDAPRFVKCPKCFANPTEKEAMQKRVRSRHETVNKRFKNWGILNQVFRHDITNHGLVFSAIATITQLQIENGEPLFQVSYSDKQT